MKKILNFVLIVVWLIIHSTELKSQTYSFKSDISFLSSEVMRGRYPGSESDSVVRQWLVSRFKNIGLKEAPWMGSYLQPFSLVEYSWFDAAMTLETGDSLLNFTFGEDFNISAQSAIDTLELEYVFIGHGIHDSLHYLMKDKAVILYNYPLPENTPLRVRRTTLEDISMAGAKAAVSIIPRSMRLSVAPAKGLPGRIRDIMLVNISNISLAHFLPEQVINNYKPEDTYSNPYMADTRSRIKIGNRRYHNVINTGNILGLKNGRGNKYIVVGAHHDHLGVKKLTGEIYYGANDNASGISTMLALTTALQDIPTNYNILFVGFGGEEKGCLGSNYFVDNLPVDKEDIAIMINLDIIGNMKNNTLNFYEKHIDLYSLVGSMDLNGISLQENDAGISDNLPFMKIGIPTIYFHTGVDREIMHTPEDTREKINYEGMARSSELLKKIILHIDSSELHTTDTNSYK